MARSIPIPDEPLSLWLRLAHIHGALGVQGPARSQLRVLYDFEIIMQLDGLSWLWSEQDRGSVDVPPGSIALVPPGFTNAWGSPEGRHISVHFDLHAKPAMAAMQNWRTFGRNVERRPARHPIPPFALRLHDEDEPLIIPFVTAPPNASWFRDQLGILVDLWSRRAVGSLDASLDVARVLGGVLKALAVPTGTSGGDPRILALVRRLDDPLGARLSVADMAAQLGMPETTFREAFVRTMGRPPRRYLEERRIEHAARTIVETDRRINDIANAVGYDDPYHFSRAFKRVTGTSPSAYRMRAQTSELAYNSDLTER